MTREIRRQPRPRPTAVLGRAVGAVAVVLALAPAPAAQAGPAEAGPAQQGKELVIEGKGWGHGVGMAQDGAHAMGRAGATTGDILNHFYPGTTLGRASGTVRVEVLGAALAAVVELPNGGQVRDDPAGAQSPGFPIELAPGGRVELSFDGARYTARATDGLIARPTTTVPPPPPPTTSVGPAPPPPPAPSPPPPVGEAASPRGLWVHPRQGSVTTVPATNRRYRGVVRAQAGSGGLRLVNEVDVEQYLRGMGEVRDPAWPPAGLQAQAIAARTYALRTVGGGGEICDTDRCQVYLGQTAEYAAMDQAVAATAGQVVMYGQSLALTVYSASAGGFSATPEEGWGASATDLPYLPAAAYPTEDPQAWVVRTDLVGAARRLGYQGAPPTVRVTRAGPSGRPLEITLEGDAGPLVVDGQRFVSALGLRSNLFTLRTEGGEPPAPVVGEEAPVVTTAPTVAARPVSDARAAGSASASAVGPVVIMAALALVVVWLGFGCRRDAGSEGLP